jgi:hypothetical protein
MLAYVPQGRPTLPEVVQKCRAVIEAQGLKIAQARRRLTAHTTATTVADTPPAHAAPPAPVNAAAVADLPTETLPQQPTHPTLGFALTAQLPIQHNVLDFLGRRIMEAGNRRSFRCSQMGEYREFWARQSNCSMTLHTDAASY